LTPDGQPIKIATKRPNKENDMERIWAPWRIQYIQMEKPAGCILCEKPKENNDVQNYILHRGDKNFIILNSYPYNPGHLMAAPYRHIANLEELTEEERHEHFEIVSRCLRALRQVFNPDGFNIGINLGRAAGAGIEDHFHTHIVPRWLGDTNFMPVLAEAKVLPEALADTYQKLKDKF
jgi:ATP adenylyltransferase